MRKQRFPSNKIQFVFLSWIILDNFSNIFSSNRSLLNKYEIEPSLININFVFWPQYYSIQNLPNEIKEKWLVKYNNEIDKYKNEKYANINSIFEQIKTHLFQNEPNLNHLNGFKEYTKLYDSIRNESIVDVFPEYAELFDKFEKKGFPRTTI